MNKFKADFPILSQPGLVYMDSAAMSLRPQSVLEALMKYYTIYGTNVRRGINHLAERSSQEYDQARDKVAKFINCKPSSVIFTRSTTSGINAIAQSWGAKFLQPGDEIIISIAEHHANFLPWQILAQRSGAKLQIVGINQEFQYNLTQFQQLLNDRTKLIALSSGSNVLGTSFDLTKIMALAQAVGVPVLIDAAQTAPYARMDLQNMGCDFLVFSGHKMLAPEGVGVLYIAPKWLDQLDPWEYGGGMVSQISKNDQSKSIWLSAPEKFEAGTMPIGAAIGLGAAVDYYNSKIDWLKLRQHLACLCQKFIVGMQDLPQIKIIGNQVQLASSGHLVSFTVAGVHAHDVAAYLDQFGICVRAGHHCAKPLHEYLGLTASVRVSFHVYNTSEEVDLLIEKLNQLVKNGL